MAGHGRLHSTVRRVSTHPWKTANQPARGFRVVSTIPRTKAAGAGTLTVTAIDARRVGTDPLSGLTDRERTLLGLLSLPNRQIANRMFYTEKTVRNYVLVLLAKLGMKRTEAITWWAAANGTAPPLRRPKLSGRGCLRARAVKATARYEDAEEYVDVTTTPWALVVFRDDPGTPTKPGRAKARTWVASYHKTKAEAEAEAEARDLKRTEIAVVDVSKTAKKRVLDDERPAIIDDDLDADDDIILENDLLDDDLDDDDGESLGQPETHPWRGNSVSAKSDAAYFSDLRSKIPPTTIAGSGVLAAVAMVDRLLAQV
jgi:DNA-binding CsgD family transcriptional regulator